MFKPKYFNKSKVYIFTNDKFHLNLNWNLNLIVYKYIYKFTVTINNYKKIKKNIITYYFLVSIV
jgi:hypothetical protein